ncbi:hypothetical protein ACHAXA_004001 [Cyclostephanos tholiformis]|jgi:hypothetical protein|uniref:Uncharacterized protein n=1 Tax=Cyclostephanos tholiformis TaxID=382380 RepID=A0ABD3R9D2_9STRA
MKLSAIVVPASLLAPGVLGFVPSSPHEQRKMTTALQAERDRVGIVKATSACALGLGLSVQAAFANDPAILEQRPHYYLHPMSVVSSSAIVAEIDKFTLPSYDAAKGSTLIDISGDLESVNKKTMEQARARREYADESAEKLEADALRKAERDGSSLFDGMIGESAKERKARIEAEKAEVRANRWKTF